MIRLVPHGEVERYRPRILNGLNRAYDGWGDAAQFDWAFRRGGDDPPAELFVAEEGTELVAGIAVVYRRVARGDGPPRLLGCLSGAWTIPGHRRTGLFGAFCRTAIARARDAGAAATIALAGEGRASAATLARLSIDHADGAVFDAPAGWSGALEANLERHDQSDIAAIIDRPRPEGLVAIVHDRASWHRQMLDRPRPVSLLRLPDGTLAAIEQGPTALSILDLSAQQPATMALAFRLLAGYARPAGLGLTAATFDPDTIAVLGTLGMNRRNFRLFVLEAEPDLADARQWRIANGDRM